MRKINLKFILSFLVAVAITQLYQNCGQLGVTGFQVQDAGVGNLASSHPGFLEQKGYEKKVLVGNRQYVAALLREIFSGRNGPIPELEALINQWILSRGAQFGEGCNPYGSYSGRDCGGDISNANLPMYVEDNTVRESFRIQFCENALGTDAGIYTVLEKLSNQGAAINVGPVQELYEMFYRGGSADDEVVRSLLTLDHKMQSAGEPLIERWRAMALQICESPGWQLL